MLNAVSDTELNLGKVKDITGKTGGIHKKACSLTYSMVPMLIFLVLIIVPWLCKLLALGKSGGKVYLSFLYHLCNFSVESTIISTFKFRGLPWQSSACLRLSASAAGAMRLIPGWRTKIPLATWYSQINKKETKIKFFKNLSILYFLSTEVKQNWEIQEIFSHGKSDISLFEKQPTLEQDLSHWVNRYLLSIHNTQTSTRY